MVTRIVSIRLPAVLADEFRTDAKDNGMSLSYALELFLRFSFEEAKAICKLEDCPGNWDSKVDVRLPTQSFDRLKATCRQHGIPVSTYVRLVLHHFYSTDKLRRVQQGNRYKLAVHHDEV